MKRKQHIVFVILASLLLSACKNIPEDAFALGPESLAQRQLQTRRFEGLEESGALAAGAGVLQDMGFMITESAFSLGLVVANKDRSARVAGDAIATTVHILFANSLLGNALNPYRNQRIIASLVTRPALGSDGYPVPKAFYVRVTFARMVWNDENELVKSEQLNDPELYRGFFERFEKSVFFEGQKI